jgi:NADH dehydrogenase
VARAAGAETDRAGRVIVSPNLTLPGHSEIFVIGDAAVMRWKDEMNVPGVAQGAIQSGKYVGKLIRARLNGSLVRGRVSSGQMPPFAYSNRGDVAIIGRLKGVTNIPWMGRFGRTSGFPAWVLWLGIHIVYLIGFANRIVVVTRWGWSFLTHGRGSRLITGQPLLPEIEEPEQIPTDNGGDA